MLACLLRGTAFIPDLSATQCAAYQYWFAMRCMVLRPAEEWTA